MAAINNNANNNINNISLAGKVIILDGPPASGKGSIAQYLNSKFGCVHISTGDIFRDHVKQNTELGRQVKKYLVMKSFVPDQLVVNHVLDRLSQNDVKQKGCILDGFPRTPQQYNALIKAGCVIDQVIQIQCPDNVLVARAKGRRINANNGKIYHINYVPPPNNVNPKDIIKRDMDNNIQTRLDVYHAQHRRFKYDKNKINLSNINGNKPIKNVFNDVLNILATVQSVSVPINDNDIVIKSGECVICMANLSDYIVIPCGHQCGCKECLTKLKQVNGKCPICRTRITSITKVFASHTGVLKKKPNKGAPKMQQIAAINILNEDVKDDNDIWPDDVKDDDNDNDNKNNDDDDEISVHIAPASKDGNIHNVVIELCGSTNVGRSPVDICCVLDTSGSMCSSAAVKEDDGSVKNDDGLSILDCVKHSVATVINMLSAKDRFSIVSFDTNAELHYGLDYMTPANMKKAVNALKNLQPSGQTNIWAGLHKGLDSLRVKKQSDRLSVIMLLTDGRPVIIPPKGHIFELTKYMDQYTDLCVQINTFGFGYDLDSELLAKLAVHGNGTYAFIPDAKIVGTTFVNSVSNILTTVYQETRLSLTTMNGAKFVGKSYGNHIEKDETWGRMIDIGPIMCGGYRYISIPMSIPGANNNHKPYLDCQISTRGQSNQMKNIKNIIANRRVVSNNLLAGHLTAKTVSIGLEAVALALKKKGNAAMKLIKSLKTEISSANTIAKNMNTDDFIQLTANDRLDALNNDACGRYSKAFRGETRFNRWGKHYLRALLRAHQLNMCTNFMDPGLQVNGGNLFREIKAKGDEVFVNLPPPKPSRRTGPTPVSYNNYNNNNYNNNNNNNNYNNYNRPKPKPKPKPKPAPAVDMSNYYGGGGGGCFAPYCTVQVIAQDNTSGCITKRVCDVRPSDMVKVADGFAKVLFVVELKRDPQRRMILFPDNGLVITGGHPIRRNGLWCLPKKQNDIQFHQGCDTVFTFVLDKSHIIIVNGMQCITWAHGLRNPIVNHSFYGTDKVIQSLQQNTIKNVIAIYQ